MSTLIGADLLNPVADLTEGKGFGVLDLHTDHAGNKYVYAQAGSAISQYAYVCIDELGAALNGTKALVDAGHQVAVAPAAFASGEYGWFQLSGVGRILTAGSCAADASIYTSATAGQVDDASTSQTQLAGIVLTTATTAAGASGPMLVGHTGIFTPATI